MDLLIDKIRRDELKNNFNIRLTHPLVPFNPPKFMQVLSGLDKGWEINNLANPLSGLKRLWRKKEEDVLANREEKRLVRWLTSGIQ